MKSRHIVSKQLININKADFSMLSRLNGLSKKKAKAILDYRKQHGFFKSIDELKKVKGIGKKTLAKIKKHLIV